MIPKERSRTTSRAKEIVNTKLLTNYSILHIPIFYQLISILVNLGPDACSIFLVLL